MDGLVQIRTIARQANIVNDIQNVYYYKTETLDAPDNAQLLALLEAWETGVLPALLDIVTDQIVYLEAQAIHVGGISFASLDLNSADGDIVAASNAPYIALEFIYRRASRLTRNGFKRFAGVSEVDVDQGGNVTGATLAAIPAAETALGAILTVGGNDWRPVIYGAANTASGLTERVNDITEVAFQRVSTQNSRKSWL